MERSHPQYLTQRHTWPYSRLMALLAMVASALILLAACGNPRPSLIPTPPLGDDLIFYDWLEDMPQSVLDAFRAEYGIRVTYTTYESMEEAAANIRSGATYDVVNLDNRFIPALIQAGALAQIHRQNVPNFKNIGPHFRGLVYDPENRYSIPYNWGTTGLVVRSDLVAAPITRWTDLWDPRYAGRVALWKGEPREVVGLALKSLGYSANSENPQELEAALGRLLELQPNAVFVEDYELPSSAALLEDGRVVLAMGWAFDAIEGRQTNPAIQYVLPKEGAMLWAESFVIPASSPHPYTAELFLNFVLRPEINAQIANENYYATPNEAAFPFIEPEIRNDSVVFPTDADLKNAEIVLPLSSAGQQLHDQIWERFLSAVP